MKKVSQEQGVDLSSCEEIAKNVKKDVKITGDNAAKCVNERIVQVNMNMEPMKEKFDDMKMVLEEFQQSSSKCVNDPNSYLIRKLACLTDVSYQN